MLMVKHISTDMRALESETKTKLDETEHQTRCFEIL